MLQENRDFTAKLYNNEDLPDVDEKYENIRQANVQGNILYCSAVDPTSVYLRVLFLNVALFLIHYVH